MFNNNRLYLENIFNLATSMIKFSDMVTFVLDLIISSLASVPVLINLRQGGIDKSSLFSSFFSS